MINLALNQDLSILLVQDHQKALFHRISENIIVEVILQSKVLRPCNEFLSSTSLEHHNLYYLMSIILHSKSESCMRQILFNTISKSKKRLQDTFLTSEGITSKFFKKINTLNELENTHQFSLRKQEDTIPKFVMSIRYEPEIIFSFVSYVYQKNIVYYDTLKKTTQVYMFWKSRCIKYTTKGCNWFPTIKSVIVRQDDHKMFKYQQITESESRQPLINRETSELFSLAPIGGRLSSEIRLNLLPNRKRTSAGLHIYAAISKLLNNLDERYLENSDHGNWNSDCLGLKSFILELSRSRLTQHQCFHHSVIVHCDLLGAPLRVLASWLLQNHSSQVTHKLLCPLLCLKHHNVMFGVFDYNHRKKETYFYAYNPFLNMVETKKYPNYISLIDRNQTLYLYSSPSRSEYFVPDDSQASYLENNWKWDHSMNGKYCHLGLHGFEHCLEQLKVSYNANVFNSHEEMKDYNWRPEYPNCVIKSTKLTDQSKKLSCFSHSGIPHIALILIFSTSGIAQEWDSCIVHHPNQDEESALSHLSAFLEDSPSPGTYNTTCIKGSYVEHCESGFYMLLYAYLAMEANGQNNFLTLMNKAKEEPDLKSKCQQWIQAIMRTKSRVNLPWLNQLISHISSNLQINQSQDVMIYTTESNEQDLNPSSRKDINNKNTSKRTRDMLSDKTRKKRTISSSYGNVRHLQSGDFVSPISTIKSPCYVGLKNPSNVCYMNVIIQLMYGMKCIQDHISKIKFQDKNQNITIALKRLFYTMTSRKDTTSVIDFKKTVVLNPLFHQFNNNFQQDSHQFLLTLLQSINNEFTIHNKNSVPFWFRSTLVSQVRCQKCHKVSTNEGDHSTSIEVEISGNCLEECLSNFFQYEVLDNEWICQNCNFKGHAYKYLLLRERPILIITMKRFNDRSQKITTNVSFPLENLSIKYVVNEENKASKKNCFKLFAVVNHLGMSAVSGHYTLYMKVNQNWLKFDDEKVTPIRKEKVNSSNAYTLVYIEKNNFKTLGS